MITSCRTHGKPSRDSDATKDSAVPCLSLSSQLQVLGLKEPLVAMSKIHSNSLHRLEREGEGVHVTMIIISIARSIAKFNSNCG
jgi:hypothetical protein